MDTKNYTNYGWSEKDDIYGQTERLAQSMEALRVTIECMKQGNAVPDHIANILLPALETFYQTRKGDFCAMLGIKLGRGKSGEAPDAIKRRGITIEVIKELSDSIPNDGRKLNKQEILKSRVKDLSSINDPDLRQRVKEQNGKLPTSRRSAGRHGF